MSIERAGVPAVTDRLGVKNPVVRRNQESRSGQTKGKLGMLASRRAGITQRN